MTLSEIQHIAQTYLDLLKNQWKLILMFMIVGAVIFGLYALTEKIEYRATVTFHPEKGKKQSLSMDPVAAILGSSFQGSEADEMIGVLKSRTLSELVSATDTIQYKGKEWLMADLILDHTPKPFSIKRFLGFGKKKEPSLERKIYLVGQTFRSRIAVVNNDYGFLVMGFKFYNHDITGLVCEEYTKALLKYYKFQKIEKAQRNYSFYSLRADSVKKELDQATYAAANFYDTQKYRTRFTAEIKTKELEGKMRRLTEVYTQMYLQMENSKSQIQQDTPVIQVLDPPLPPFEGTTSSKMFLVIMGLMLGLIIGAIYATRKQLKVDIIDLINEALQPEED